MTPPRLRSFIPVVTLCVVLSACLNPTPGRDVLQLNNVGRIPGINSAGGVVVVNGVRASYANYEGSTLGSRADGNKLLVLGDSILAATASRYGGAMCSALVPLGWSVAVEAEAGQMVGFGRTVLKDRIYEGWNAAVVFLGTNYGGSATNYSRDLTAIIDALAPRPTLLLTATLFKPVMQDVNAVIRTVASKYPNVVVLDWGTAAAQPGLMNRDNVHPNDTGRQVLVGSIATALGNAPMGTGSCLPSKYTDDSLVTGDNTMPSSSIAGQSTVPGASTIAPQVTNAPLVTTTTTIAPSVVTTVP
jgi:lysophospholipase L1-like esterase